MLFFDTNVLVYAVDKAEAAKQPVAMQLLRKAMADKTLTLSTQVLQEIYGVAQRKKLMAAGEAVEMLRIWAGYEVVAGTPQLLFRAFELQQKLRISVWDALIVQAALDAGCTTLYTEDLQHGTRVGDLEIVNPFFQPAAMHEPRPAYAKAKPSARGMPPVRVHPAARGLRG
jgi:predicted nucleic acid-binding protein